MLRKIGLFFLSLWLLFLLLIIITADIPMCFSKNSEFVGFGYLISHNIIPLFCIISLIIGAFSYYDFIFTTKGSPNLSFEIMEIENIDYEHLTFLTTYIFPLITFNFVSIRYQIVFFILLLVIGIIYIRTDLFYANPTLAILRFRIYKVNGLRKGNNHKNKILITSEKLSITDRVKYIKLDERIYYAVKVK